MHPPYSYTAFGLTLEASDPIPGLHAVSHRRPADIRIWMNDGLPGVCNDAAGELWYPASTIDGHADGLKVWRLGGGRFFRLLYADGTEFFVDRRGIEIYARWPNWSTLEDTAIYLLGPVLGFALRLRGTVCLHASAVQIGNAAIALLGPGEAGKSTTAAAFSRMGYRILTDDVAPLLEAGGAPHLQPSYPQLRLWPDSVALLYGSEGALRRLTPSWAKCALDLTSAGDRFQHEPLPLAAVYVLAGRAGSELRIEAITGCGRLPALVAHSYVGYLLDRTMREQEFNSLARVASAVPVRRVAAPQCATQVFRVCTRIAEDCEAIRCTALPTMAR